MVSKTPFSIVLHGDIGEIQGVGIFVSTPQEALDLLAEARFEGAEKLILHKENIAPAFFELGTGLAGEILQKFVNYQMPLAIVGDFEHIESTSLRAFIAESNRGKGFRFVPDVETAKQFLA